MGLSSLHRLMTRSFLWQSRAAPVQGGTAPVQLGLRQSRAREQGGLEAVLLWACWPLAPALTGA